jgi:hypothetical protein
MVAVPAAIAVTNPVALTLATSVLLEDQVTARPVRGLPLASFVTTVSCWVGVIPRTRVAFAGLTVTVATGAEVTVSGELPVLPSLVATMFAVPALTAETRPEDDTVATEVLSELHVTVRPASERPFASSSVAVAWVV